MGLYDSLGFLFLKFIVCVYYSRACAIEDPDTQTVVITGGDYTLTTVSVYGLKGWVEDLEALNTGRRSHACTSYKTAGIRVRYV